MSWIVPPVTRVNEPFVGDERAMLRGLLNRQRDSLLHRCVGLNGDQLIARKLLPSRLSLLGLVRHLATVERTWFRSRVAGEGLPMLYTRGAAFEDLDPAAAESDFAALRRESDLGDTAVAEMDLESTFTHDRYGEMSLRWVYQHMIEEYARHLGHADLLRERIDSTVGT